MPKDCGSRGSPGFIPEQQPPTEGRGQGSPNASAQALAYWVTLERTALALEKKTSSGFADPTGLNEWLCLYPVPHRMTLQV